MPAHCLGTHNVQTACTLRENVIQYNNSSEMEGDHTHPGSSNPESSSHTATCHTRHTDMLLQMWSAQNGGFLQNMQCFMNVECFMTVGC